MREAALTAGTPVADAIAIMRREPGRSVPRLRLIPEVGDLRVAWTRVPEQVVSAVGLLHNGAVEPYAASNGREIALLDADLDQLSAKINQANAKANVALKYYELQFAQGNLLNSLNISK